MKIEVSVGEIVDKLNILELKLKKIKDSKKIVEIQKEIVVLKDEIQETIKNYDLYYSILMHINEKIWDLTDVVKSMNAETEYERFAKLSKQIFDLNQKRFRLKNWFNLLTDSNIKEQKSYSSNCCRIIVQNESVFFKKLAEINYLAIEYDFITFESPILSTIRESIKIPTVIYNNESSSANESSSVNGDLSVIDSPVNTIDLSTFQIPSHEFSLDVFTEKPISYLAGGMFGDFIHSLSIINEMFYKTGKKGILYISDTGDTFFHGVEHTYHDTYTLIKKQDYIESYKIYNNEPFDVNLNEWRNNPLLYGQNFHSTYLQTYGVNWGQHRWLKYVPNDDNWKEKIVINTTYKRFPIDLNFQYLKEYSDIPENNKNMIFIYEDAKQKQDFESRTNIQINHHVVYSFLELATIINSCKFFIGSLSGPMAVAYSLHKNCVCGYNDTDRAPHVCLDKIMPNIHFKIEDFI